MTKGKFIVLEGLDRSGKSSLTKYISIQLPGQNQIISYPNRTTKIGTMINEFLTNKLNIGNQAIHLLFSANRWQTTENIKKNLNQGKNIICDRYWYSGVAYSNAKGLDLQWCISADEGLVQPDLIIYLKGDPQNLSKRPGYGQQRFQRLDFQKKVESGFNKIFERVNKQKLVIIDINNKTLDEVKNQTNKIIKERIL